MRRVDRRRREKERRLDALAEAVVSVGQATLVWREVQGQSAAFAVAQQLSRDLAWAARAPANESTWARVGQDASNVLTVLWRNGELLGAKPEQAFLVKCDRTTMTQNDIDNGRLIVEVGVAPVKPAEFVIIRIDQLGRPRRRWWCWWRKNSP